MVRPSRTSWALAALVLTVAVSARPARAQVAFQPGIGTFSNGAFLPVVPVVSDDRRYVRLSLAPQFNGLEGFDTYSVPAAVSGGPGGGVGGLGGGAGGGGGRLAAAGMNGVFDPGAAPAQVAGFGPGRGFNPGATAVLSGFGGPVAPPQLSAGLPDPPQPPRTTRKTRRPSRPAPSKATKGGRTR